MPRGDGAGSKGRVAGTGCGTGRGQGGGIGAGPGENCVCPNCGEKVPHQSGKPCYDQKCPKYGAAMMRE